MNYETFLIEYRAAFQQLVKYGPDTVGAFEALNKMASLADAYPGFADRADEEKA